MQFTLHIELGNDAMDTGADLARALRGVANRLQRDGGDDPDALADQPHGVIIDLNGNTVGRWSVA